MDDHPFDIDWAEIGACASFSLDDLRDNDLSSFNLMCDSIIGDTLAPQESDLESTVTDRLQDEGPGHHDAAMMDIPSAGLLEDHLAPQGNSSNAQESATVSYDAQQTADLLQTVSFPGQDEFPANVDFSQMGNFMDGAAGDDIQLSLEVAQADTLGGIQATDMNSLLEQFEDASAWQGSSDLEVHHLLDGGRFKSHSVPASRVCSTAASPATTPPATPPPMLLNKIRSRQKESVKRKAAMIPMGGPAKRGRGQGASLQVCGSSGGSSRLQKILSRHQPEPDCPVQAVSAPSTDLHPPGLPQLLPAQPQLVSVLQPHPAPPVDPIHTSVGFQSAQPQIVFVSQPLSVSSGAVFTPVQQNQSVVQAPQSVVQAPQSVVQAPQSVVQAPLPVSQFRQVSLLTNSIGKPVTIASAADRAIRPLVSKAAVLVTSTPAVNTGASNAVVTKLLNSVQPQASCTQISAKPVPPAAPTPTPQLESNEDYRTVILIRGEEKLPATHQASILDHDYAEGCPQRIDTDIRELDTSPSKTRTKKPLHRVGSMPVMGTDKGCLSQPVGQSLRNTVASNRKAPVMSSSLAQMLSTNTPLSATADPSWRSSPSKNSAPRSVVATKPAASSLAVLKPRLLDPRVAQSVDKPRVALSVDKPRVAQSVDKPRVAQSVDKPRVAPSVDKPRVAQSVDKPTIARSVDKPTIARSVDKPTIARSVDKPTIARSVDKPTIARSVDKPRVAQSVDKPRVAQSVDKPTPVAQAAASVKDQWQQLKDIVENITQLTNNHALNKNPATRTVAVSSPCSSQPATAQAVPLAVPRVALGQAVNKQLSSAGLPAVTLPVPQVTLGQAVSNLSKQLSAPHLSAVTTNSRQFIQVHTNNLPVPVKPGQGTTLAGVHTTAQHTLGTKDQLTHRVTCVASESGTRADSMINSAVKQPSLSWPQTLTGTSGSARGAAAMRNINTSSSASPLAQSHDLPAPQRSGFLQEKGTVSEDKPQTAGVAQTQATQLPAGSASHAGGLSADKVRMVLSPHSPSVVSNRQSLGDIAGNPPSGKDSLDSDVLYSMPQFDFDDFPSADMSDRVVAPVEVGPRQDNGISKRLSPSATITCDKLVSPPCSPCVSPVRQTVGGNASASLASPNPTPHSPGQSPQHDAAFRPGFDQAEEFATLWEECAAARLEHMTQTRSSAVHSTDPSGLTEPDRRTSPTKVDSALEIFAQPNNSRHCRDTTVKPGVGNVATDDLFSKIPSYLNEISVAQNSGRKQLKVGDIEKGLSASDHLPLDHSAPVQGEIVLDKIPSYFKCFTDSQQYDGMDASAGFDLASQSEGQSHGISRPDKVMPASAGHSPQQSMPSARARGSRSRARKGSRGRKGPREQRRSNTRSLTARSRSRSGARRDRERQRRSPTVSGSSHSSCKSRSRSTSSSRLSHSSSRSPSRSRSRSRSAESRYSSYSRKRHDYHREADRMPRSQGRRKDGQKRTDERKIVYVGKIPDRYTKRQLYDRFKRFGVVESASVHFREAGDNYGFVTFRRTEDAYRAIENGNKASNEQHFDLCFGGRRQFCGNDYADLDGNRVIEEEYNPGPAQKESFDQLLRKYYQSQH